MNDSTITLKENLIKHGGKEWIRADMERIYITTSILNILEEEKGLLKSNFGENNNKIFFDVKTNSVMRSYKNKKPIVEIQF